MLSKKINIQDQDAHQVYLYFFGLYIWQVSLLRPFYDIRIYFEENLIPCHF